MRNYEEEYYKAFVNPNLNSSFKCWTKGDQKKIISMLNHIYKHNLNLEKSRVMIDDVDYFIDVQENFIAKIL